MKHTPRNTGPASLSLEEAMHLQALESNPLDAEQTAMFEMFDLEGWSPEQRRAHIRQRCFKRVGAPAAE